MTTSMKELIACFDESGPKLTVPEILARLRVIEGRLAEQPAQQEPVAERFEAMHANGDIWITTIAAAAIARNTSPPAQRKPLTDEEIEKLREKTFSTGNPYCPVDSKSMKKAARAIEAAHGIKDQS